MDCEAVLLTVILHACTSDELIVGALIYATSHRLDPIFFAMRDEAKPLHMIFYRKNSSTLLKLNVTLVKLKLRRKCVCKPTLNVSLTTTEIVHKLAIGQVCHCSTQ